MPAIYYPRPGLGHPADSHMAEWDRKQAEKACQRAEELFLAGNIRGAHRQASRAKRLSPSLPGVGNAFAAYEVHAAAAASWRAVLGVRPGAAATHVAIRKQFRRLSLLVHPDKNRCAAAEGAFKLLLQVCDAALSAEPSRCAAPDDEPQAAEPPPPKDPPRAWQKIILVYCPSCKNEFTGRIGTMEEKVGMKCDRCPEWLNPPWQKKPPVKKEPPAGPGRTVFACPAQCPECGMPYVSKVCVGEWCLRCRACSKPAMVDVRGPGMAIATIKRRG